MKTSRKNVNGTCYNSKTNDEYKASFNSNEILMQNLYSDCILLAVKQQKIHLDSSSTIFLSVCFSSLLDYCF